MGIERDSGRDEPAVDRALKHRLVTAMHAVEDADRNRSLTRIEP